MISAPSTRPMPAEAVQLLPSFAPERFGAEIDALRSDCWERQRVYGGDIGKASAVDWRCLALRSPGGDGSRTDPGGPGTEEFANTEWHDRVPYVRTVLDAVPAPLRSVRFMALGPGAVGHDHHDTKYGPAWGVARLHVPITTDPDAVLVLDGVVHRWQPGSFWFGDFSRTHRVENRGTSNRIHLVIDCLVVPELAELFPDEWQEYFEHGDVLYGRGEKPLSSTRRRQLTCEFDMPRSFSDWEEADGAFLSDDDVVRAAVEETGSGLQLRTEDGRCFLLVHVGDDEFRFAGWSEERTVRLPAREESSRLLLRTRIGRAVREMEIPRLSG